MSQEAFMPASREDSESDTLVQGLRQSGLCMPVANSAIRSLAAVNFKAGTLPPFDIGPELQVESPCRTLQ